MTTAHQIAVLRSNAKRLENVAISFETKAQGETDDVKKEEFKALAQVARESAERLLQSAAHKLRT